MKRLLLCVLTSGALTPLAFSACPEALQTLVNQYLSNYALPENITAVALTVNLPNGTVNSCYAGRTSTLPDAPVVTSNNLSQVGSITKSFVSTLLLQLAAQGKINLNAPISDYLQNSNGSPLYPKWNAVTVKELLNMTSGIPSYTALDKFYKAYNQNPIPGPAWTPQQLVALAYNADCTEQSGCFAPGASYSYSNTNYILAGMIVSAVTGQTLESELRQLFAKYGLSNTFYLPYSYLALPSNYNQYAIPSRMIHGYWNIPNAIIPINYPLDTDLTNLNVSYGSAAGAITSNTENIAQWTRLLLDGNVLPTAQRLALETVVCEDPKTMCQLGTPIAVNAQNQEGYGLGVNESYNKTLGDYWNYEGITWGYRFMWAKFNQSDVVVAASANSDTYSNTPACIQNPSPSCSNDHLPELVTAAAELMQQRLATPIK